MADGTEKVPRAVSGPPHPESFTHGNGANAQRTPPPYSGTPKVSSSKRMPTRRDRWKLWNWRVRTKLFAVLLVPALAAGVLGSVQVSTELGGVESLGRTVRQVELGSQAAALVHEVQYERALMAGFVAFGRKGDRANLDLQKRRVDGLAASLRSASGRTDDMDQLVKIHYRQAVNALNGLTALREVAETQRFSDQSVVIVYTSLINAMLELSREIARATVAKDVSDIAASADSLGRAKEQVSQQHAIMLVAILHNQIDPNQAQDLRVADSRFGAAVSEFRSVANPIDRQRYDDTVTGPEVDDRERLKLSVLQAESSGGQRLNMTSANVEDWDKASGRTTELINKVQTGLITQLRGGTITLREQAGDEAVRDATILLGSLLLTLLLVVVVARSMLVPLRVLKNTAFDVADRRLPEAIQRMRDAEGDPAEVAIAPVAVHTREEIGQVARAFDAVHGEAVRLAAEQALLRRNVNDMFVNLSRRSQGLVERQLRLISQLETNEQDPEQLSNLFQLDHLATRMRRNSENLLVLAGADLARRSARPISAVDVLRAALSEVEEYQRVDVLPPPPARVLGMAVNDIVHLIAELLDNATTFSPPHTRVIVSSRLSGQGEFVVEISDQGVGMTEAQLLEANQRLADPPMVDVSVSRRMGLFVVGRLAGRNRVRVRLAPNGDVEGTGLKAIVEVPSDLVQTTDLDTTVMPATGGDELLLEPTGGGELLVGRTLHNIDARPGIQDDYPSDWPERDTGGHKAQPERQEPIPYEVGATAPMQVTMVDAMSGTDLFTPASVPTISQQPDSSPPRPQEYDAYPGSTTGAERDYQGFTADYGLEPHGDGAWPDTDQDVTRETSAAAIARYGAPADSAASNSVAANSSANGAPEPEGSREDFLGVSDEMVRARTAGAVETTPIYEEMVSAWFRETTSSTVSAGQPPAESSLPAALPRVRRAERPTAVPQPARPRHAAQAERLPARPAPATQPPAVPPPPAEPVRELLRPGAGKATPRPAARSAPEPERVARPVRPMRGAQPGRNQADAGPMEPAVSGSGRPGGSDDWTSPADEGWLAAGTLLTPGNNGFTSAGLPKRRKGAHLVPGAASSSVASEPSRPSVRNPDSVRGRLASYQQGLRQGRDARHDLAHAGLEQGSDQAGQQSTNEERQ